MAASSTTATPAGRARTSARVTRRRAHTRGQLLDAALAVFAEIGFGRSTVEQVCERAGFTRGAFYSNFSSLDELFLTMWEQRSRRMLQELRSRLDGLTEVEPERVLRVLLGSAPVDDAWYRVSAEFTVHALRHPELRRVVAARERAIQQTITPVVVAALARAGRQVADPEALGHALVAVHDGTAVQCLLETGSTAATRRREQLFLRVLDAYSTPNRKRTT